MPSALAAQSGVITDAGTPAQVKQVSGSNVITVAASSPLATNRTDLITLNFEGTDVRTVLLYLAKITGDTILPDKSVRGTDVTIINPKPMTPEQAKKVIFSLLEMQGFTIVRYDDYVKVVRSEDAKTKPIETRQPPKKY